MKLGMATIDEEIHALERRIAEDRDALDHAVMGCRESVRTAVSSPKSLLAVAGLGFAAGTILFRRGSKPEPPKRKTGWLGLLAGTAISVLQPKFGLGTVARWALKRMFEERPGGQVRSAAAARAWAGSRHGVTTTAPRHYGQSVR